MTTQIHTDGIKTVVHTSNFALDRQASFLRRSGADEATVAYFYEASAAAEKTAHLAEHDRKVAWIATGYAT